MKRDAAKDPATDPNVKRARLLIDQVSLFFYVLYHAHEIMTIICSSQMASFI